MRYILSVEVKSSVWNLRFFGGVLLILLSALITGQPYAKQLLEAGYSAEGVGWFAMYIYYITAGNALLFIPIAAPLAAGGNAELELRSRYSLFYISRTGKKPYLLGKAIGAAVSGGLMVCFAMGLLLVVTYIRLWDIPLMEKSVTSAVSMVSAIALSFLRGFLNGALWALVGSFSAIMTRNRYLAFAVPFVLYYVLAVFQERYYQKLFILSPRYWAAPVYYDNLLCIAILLGCFLTVVCLFLWVGKRRLSHA